jgi:hypothetical protein
MKRFLRTDNGEMRYSKELYKEAYVHLILFSFFFFFFGLCVMDILWSSVDHGPFLYV